MNYLSSLFLFLVIGSLHAQTSGGEKKAILEVLMQQQQHWNEGNITAFMEGYWKSDSVIFTGRNGVTLGWETVLQNYQRSYPSREAMGKLTFTVLQLHVYENQTALLVGQWKLTRQQDEPGGFFTLVWRKIRGKWVIVADHTS